MNREKYIKQIHDDFKSGKIDFGEALDAIKLSNSEIKKYKSTENITENEQVRTQNK